MRLSIRWYLKTFTQHKSHRQVRRFCMVPLTVPLIAQGLWWTSGGTACTRITKAEGHSSRSACQR